MGSIFVVAFFQGAISWGRVNFPEGISPGGTFLGGFFQGSLFSGGIFPYTSYKLLTFFSSKHVPKHV